MSIRLIADENISWRLKKLIPDWNIIPLNEIRKGKRLSDMDIWRFAQIEKYTILTFDEDFSEIQNLYGFPPKIIWLRTGNIRTKEIASVLKYLEEKIKVFLEDAGSGIYEIYL